MRCRTRDGREAYGVPSPRAAGHCDLTTRTTCTCPHAQRHEGLACKHQLAVRLHVALVTAQRTRKGVKLAA
jgi:uncharacterized Zn finger protein